MTNPVHLVINGQSVRAESDWSVLEAARHNGVKIPHFCYLEGVHQIGSCRICVVEVEGMRSLQASCTIPVRDGMIVKTNTARVKKARGDPLVKELTVVASGSENQMVFGLVERIDAK